MLSKGNTISVNDGSCKIVEVSALDYDFYDNSWVKEGVIGLFVKQNYTINGKSVYKRKNKTFNVSLHSDQQSSSRKVNICVLHSDLKVVLLLYKSE